MKPGSDRAMRAPHAPTPGARARPGGRGPVPVAMGRWLLPLLLASIAGGAGMTIMTLVALLARAREESLMRFGVFSFCRSPYEDIAARVRQAEALGFGSAWVNDDLLVPSYGDLEPWTLLGALARDTSRIRLGTMVSAITFRHPTLLASQVASVDLISSGRVELGLGAGGPPHPYGAFSLNEWSPRERADRLAEYTAVIDPLLRGERVSRDSRYYPVQDAQLPAIGQRPHVPLTIAAHGERTLRTAARYADSWNTLGGQPYPDGADPQKRLGLPQVVDRTRQLSERLDAICLEEGRDPATIRRSVLAMFPNPDPFSSLDAFDEYVGGYGAIGIDQIIFYWPPMELQYGGHGPVPAELEKRYERIAAERVANR
jgi:alkanesulfonate monooxygenase SsuD/methylene tetrahydromethanopterin reductase-like flavin-dependent oxidoreductase (luciferase family)